MGGIIQGRSRRHPLDPLPGLALKQWGSKEALPISTYAFLFSPQISSPPYSMLSSWLLLLLTSLHALSSVLWNHPLPPAIFKEKSHLLRAACLLSCSNPCLGWSPWCLPRPFVGEILLPTPQYFFLQMFVGPRTHSFPVKISTMRTSLFVIHLFHS